MISLVLISAISIVFGSTVLLSKKINRFDNFLSLLLFGAVALTIQSAADENGKAILLSSVAIVAINYIASYFSVLRKKIVQLVVPIISLGAFLFMFQESGIVFLDETYVLVNKFVLAGVVLATLSVVFGELKALITSKMSIDVEEGDVIKLVSIFLLGFAIFLGDFGASSIGVFVVGMMLLSVSFYTEKSNYSFSVGLLMIVLTKFIASSADVSSVNMLSGDVINGLFIGAFSIFTLNKLSAAKNNSLLFTILGIFLTICLVFLISLLETQNANMGGMDGFIGVLIGGAIVLVVLGDVKVGIVLTGTMLALGSYIPSLLVNEELKAFEESQQVIETDNESTDEIELVNLSSIPGEYKILSDESNVAFSLGKEGETKGAFKKINGEVKIGESIEVSTFRIELSMDDFTTFNKFRDGSLMGEEYFKTDQFPTMSFSSNKVVDLGNSEYKIIGEFTMLGNTKPQEVSLIAIESEGVITIQGEGEIDRTIFGMTPSATEGNVVSFKYTAVLSQ